MASSSDDDNPDNWVPFSQRPDWHDVQPLHLPLGQGPVVEIKYTAKVKEVLGYFRAIRAAKELSPRALELTQEVIYVNSADYTAWAYRWQCLEQLGSLESEMPFIHEMARRSPKNYQLWNHRRRVAFKRGAEYAQQELAYAAECLSEDAKNYHACLTMMSAAMQELAYAADCLSEDAKNYHAWAHRQAIVKQFGLWQQELQVTAHLLQEDVRNNSAWNQRFFVLSKSADMRGDSDSAQAELKFCMEKILLCPHNESAWNYMRGLLQLMKFDSTAAVTLVCQFCIKAQSLNVPTAGHWAELAGKCAMLLTSLEPKGFVCNTFGS